MGCYLKEHGLGLIACEQDSKRPIQLEIMTTKGTELAFKSSGIEPIQHIPDNLSKEEKSKIQKFIKVVNNALRDYMHFLGTHQETHHGRFFRNNLAHGKSGANRAHRVWSSICSKHIHNYASLVKNVYDIVYATRITHPGDNAFKTILDVHIKRDYDSDMRGSISVEVNLSYLLADILAESNTARPVLTTV